MIVFTTYLARMGCAFVLGTIVGVERQMRQRNAGLRTNILVSVGAAAFTVLSYAMTSGNGDPSRVAAQIVSGIGFLGGGLILKDGFTVRGLNTAATIWCSAACGTLSGVGLYAEAVVLVGCVLMTHCLFRPLCFFLEKRTTKLYHYSVRAECQRNALDSIQKLIMDTLSFDQDVKLNALFYKGDDNCVEVCCDMNTLGEHKLLLDLVVSRLRARTDVISAGWEKEEISQEDF